MVIEPQFLKFIIRAQGDFVNLDQAGDIIEESTKARHRYLDVQKKHEETLEQQGGSKRRATGTTRMRAPASAELASIATLSYKGLPKLPRWVVDKVLGNLFEYSIRIHGYA